MLWICHCAIPFSGHKPDKVRVQLPGGAGGQWAQLLWQLWNWAILEAGTKIQTSMAPVHILSLMCCYLLPSLWKFLPVLTQLGHTTTPTLSNCQVLISSCTHTITNANIQLSSIMKPKYFRSCSNLMTKIIHSKRKNMKNQNADKEAENFLLHKN